MNPLIKHEEQRTPHLNSVEATEELCLFVTWDILFQGMFIKCMSRNESEKGE